ncbi:MAG: filamentous hemagglutinin N-terminal domain-containing protein [Geitlerinemataceae cyanobacterium]
MKFPEPHKIDRLLTVTLIVAGSLNSNPVSAQIVPDATLPVNSQVTVEGNTFTLDGGTATGSNLFHSFSEFSLPTGWEAFFNNAVNIDNIFTRVTGGQVSNIDGLIRANGGANLFLLNPNGIVFGPNAQLNLGGSFFASTANEIVFADGVFSAMNPEGAGTGAPPLLSINVPVGLQYGENPGAIVDRSRVSGVLSGNTATTGLQVNSGETLALVGGEVQLDGGNLTAEGGRIELGSVGEGFVGIGDATAGFPLTYSPGQPFTDITLSNGSIVETSGNGGGTIQVRGRNISLFEGSQIRSNTLGSGMGGDVTVMASEAVTVRGRLPNLQPSALQVRVQGENATGTGGNLTLEAPRLTVAEGARVAVSSLTPNPADGGNLTVRVSQRMEIAGVATQNGELLRNPAGEVLPSQLSSVTTGAGNAGYIAIEAGELIATDGGQVTASTLGSQDAGIVTVAAQDITLTGRSIDGSEPSGLLARVEPGGTGNANNLTVEAQRLRVEGGARIAASSLWTGDAGDVRIRSIDVEVLGVIRDENGIPNTNNPSQISALTIGSGNAGDITVETDRLQVRDGGQIVTSTLSSGDGGDLRVTAEDVSVFGRLDAGNIPSGLLARVEPIGDVAATGTGGTLTLEVDRLRVNDRSRVAAASQSVGDAGNVNISARNRLEVTDGGEISVRGLSTGEPGNLTVSGSILLDRQGSLSASSQAGRGGNIALKSPNLQLRRESLISAEGSTFQETFDGNIDLDAETIVLLENSGIRTNAANPQGGSNINIRPLDGVGVAIFRSPDSTISAAGNLSVEGKIEVDANEPAEIEVADADDIARGCLGTGRSQFTTTGRGGLPPSPYEPLENLDLLEDIELPMAWWESSAERTPLVEARGWVRTESGQIVLVATMPIDRCLSFTQNL